MPTVKIITPPSLEEAEAKIAEFDAKIKQLEALVQERLAWVQYRDSLRRVLTVDPIKIAATAGRVVKRPPKGSTTVDHAEAVLTTFGPEMHLLDIVKRMREASGWEGSGDDSADKGRVYSAMHRASDKFEKVGGRTLEAQEV